MKFNIKHIKDKKINKNILFCKNVKNYKIINYLK